jgi:hypothetical protein
MAPGFSPGYDFKQFKPLRGGRNETRAAVKWDYRDCVRGRFR